MAYFFDYEMEMNFLSHLKKCTKYFILNTNHASLHTQGCLLLKIPCGVVIFSAAAALLCLGVPSVFAMGGSLTGPWPGGYVVCSRGFSVPSDSENGTANE